ncbi:MAG: monovalent cation/H(+) antiporter subunit G [Pseudohongiella sp.]|nr:monovalent cation/H(+) antiporter subunit G [Pseudohongiella sp.]
MSGLVVIVAWIFMIAGTVFFVTGALGLLRFPDVYSRLHAVTKTDTLGLGLLTLGLALKSGSPGTALLLFVIWLLVLASGAVNCQLLARYNLELEARAADTDELNRQGGNHDV